MGEEGEVEVMGEGVEGEATVGDVVGGRLGEDAAESAAASRRLRRVFTPDFQLVVGGRGGEIPAERGGDPLDLGLGV